MDSNVIPKFPAEDSCSIVGKQLEQGRTLDKREYLMIIRDNFLNSA